MNIKSNNKSWWLTVFLCWMVYTSSYIGKINYSANINPIMAHFGINHADAGLVSTAFFFAYGIGQIVNGILCKKYNVRWIIFTCLMISGAINLTIPLLTDFSIIKYLWCINGFTLSVLWPSLIRLLAESIPRESMPRASIVMGTTSTMGTLLTYALSALFNSVAGFKLSFFTAAGLLITIGIVWILLLPKNDGVADELCDAKTKNTGGIPRVLLPTVLTLALFGVFTNLIKDGLTTWVPSILKERYGFGDSLSIALTLLLPTVALLDNLLANLLHRKVPSYVVQATIVFSAAALLIGGVKLSFGLSTPVPTIIGFALVCLLVCSNNAMITSLFPLFMKGRLNSGLVAGVLNGFCYLGSTISSWGLGAIADSSGWEAVLTVLMSAALCSVPAAIIHRLVSKNDESA